MDSTRIAWLVPSVELGAYWQPVLREFSQIFPHNVFYTGKVWPGFDPQAPGNDRVQIVGKMGFVETTKVKTGYGRGVIIVSPAIVGYLLKFKPQVVLPQVFSLWTLLVILLKPIARWQIIIIHDGSSPNTDFRDDSLRTNIRKFLARFAEAFIANSEVGKEYLENILGIPPEKIFKKTYLVPDAEALQKQLVSSENLTLEGVKSPIFLYVGRITERKGLKSLVAACSLLKEWGYDNYTLLLIGEGEQKPELEQLIEAGGIKEQIKWVGWVDYGHLGTYFNQADVFVFPTYEDVWGMVVPEAMIFGKPILCSRGAAAMELVKEGDNGYLFNPHSPEEIAEGMRKFIDERGLIGTMGARSRQIIAQTTPKTAAQGFVEVINQVHSGVK